MASTTVSLRVCTGEAFGLPACKYAVPSEAPPPKTELQAKPSLAKPSKGPSLVRRGLNYAKAQVRHTANRRRTVTDDQRAARLAVCNACPSLNQQTRACTEKKCGCYVDKKAGWESERCPLGKWPQISERIPAPAGSTRWAVGITAAPRPDPTLLRMADSAIRAGFDPVVYAEPGTDLADLPCPAVVREELLGPWQNWRQTLADLLAADPAAEALLVLQDDIVFCRNVRALVERQFLWPQKCGVLSIYSPRHSWKGGYYKDKGGVLGVNRHHLIGACALVFPRAVAERICSPEFAEHHGCWDSRAKPAAPHRKRAIEKYVRDAVTKMGLRCYYVAPSLAQHIGETSAIFPDNPNRRATIKSGRASRSFPGEEACAFEAHGFRTPEYGAARAA